MTLAEILALETELRARGELTELQAKALNTLRQCEKDGRWRAAILARIERDRARLCSDRPGCDPEDFGFEAGSFLGNALPTYLEDLRNPAPARWP